MSRVLRCAAALALLPASIAGASVAPFTETFSEGNAAWGTGTAWQLFDPLDWNMTGGPDGGGYVFTSQNFVDTVPVGFPSTFFRGQDNYGSSNGAFVGDWLNSGITEFSFWFRHDAPVALSPFARFTPVGANSPSMNVLFTEQAQANTWTQFTISIDPANPDFVVGGGPGTFDAVFGNLGKIQLGADIAELAGLDQLVTLELALVSIAIPGPGAAALCALFGLTGSRRRRGKEALRLTGC